MFLALLESRWVWRDNVKLNSFYLESYIDIKNSHRFVIDQLEDDHDAKIFLGNLGGYINKVLNRKEEDILYNDVYIAYYQDHPIGFISLTHEKDIYEIASGVLKEARGKHLGALLLREFTQKVFETCPRIDKLTLIIKNSNTRAIKTAISVGYQFDGQYYSQKRK